jgi:hypothetical protein
MALRHHGPEPFFFREHGPEPAQVQSSQSSH